MLGTPIEDRGSLDSESSVGPTPSRGDGGSASDSGDSIFITQKPVRLRRRSRFGVKSSSSASKPSSNKDKRHGIFLPPCSFSLLQEDKPINFVLTRRQNINIHTTLIGSFFRSVRELQAGRQAGDLPSSLPTVDLEGDFIAPIAELEEILEEEDIRVVKKKEIAVLSKTKRPQPWCDAQRVNQQSGVAAETSISGLRGASQSCSGNVRSPGNRQTCNQPTRIQPEASKAKRSVDFHEGEKQEAASDSDATVCELPDEQAQSDGGGSAAGAELQADEQEEPEDGGQDDADGGDRESVEGEKDHRHGEAEGLDVEHKILDPQEGSDVPDSKHKKKKKKKKRVDEDVNGQEEGNSEILRSGVTSEGADKKKKRKGNDEDEERLNSDEAADVQNADLTSHKKKMKKSETCFETSEEASGERKKKKKKKKKKHQLGGDKEYSDVSFSHDAIDSAENQELVVESSFLESNGSTENPAEGARDEDHHLVTKKKKKKKEKVSLNPCSDTMPQSDDSVSVQTTEEKRQTSSFPAADAEKSVSESAESNEHDQVRKKKKRRMLEATTNDGKPSETVQMDEETRKKQKRDVLTPTGELGSADYHQTDEDGAVKKKKKKKKKKKDTEEVPVVESEHIQSPLDSWSSLTHEMDAKTGHDASPSTHTDSASTHAKKKKKRKDLTDDLSKSADHETETGDTKRTKLTADFSDDPVGFEKSAHRKRKKKRTLCNPSEDFLTEC